VEPADPLVAGLGLAEEPEDPGVRAGQNPCLAHLGQHLVPDRGSSGAEIRGPARQAIARDGLGPVEPARAGLAMEVLDPVGLRQWASATHERRPQNGQNLAAHTSAGDRGLPAIAKGYSERTGHPRLLRPPAGDAPCSLGALRDCTKSLGDVARDYDPSGGTERFKSSRPDQHTLMSRSEPY
jgi:hypothetical protein